MMMRFFSLLPLQFIFLLVLLPCSSLYAAPPQCSRPISYSIGQVDPEFGISKQAFRSIAGGAARFWEFGTGERRFYEAKKGEITINLKYTARQDVVEAIKILEAETKVMNESVEEFNDKMDRLNKKIDEYNERRIENDTAIREHNAEVRQYSKRPGRAPAYKQHLSQQGAFLRSRSASLLQTEIKLRNQKAILDSQRDNLGHDITEFEKDQVDLQSILARMPDYERLGEYRQSAMGREINLFVVRNKQQLKLLLAHEFGHALGIKHVPEPGALMYMRETLDNTELRTLQPGDLKAFRAICGQKGKNPTGHYF